MLFGPGLAAATARITVEGCDGNQPAVLPGAQLNCTVAPEPLGASVKLFIFSTALQRTPPETITRKTVLSFRVPPIVKPGRYSITIIVVNATTDSVDSSAEAYVVIGTDKPTHDPTTTAAKPIDGLGSFLDDVHRYVPQGREW